MNGAILPGSLSPGLHVVVLAAGFSSRLGRPKALTRVRSSTLLRRTLALVASFSPARIAVVLPPRAARYRLEAHGFKVAEAPSLDLCSVSGTLYPRQAGESCVQWYGRINVAGAAATGSDIYILQDESNTTNLNQYASLYATSASQARAANSAVKVYSEVSTANGTPDQMTAAAESISPDGFYVAAPGAIPQVDQFFQNLKAAGY